MSNRGCNCSCVSSGYSDYSSPVPVIGLYIAGGSLLCIVLLLVDVVAGFRYRKLWFPCKWFSINSVTLSLLSVAAKLPVDLTTVMPGHEDQLSKLSGTSFVCISMGLLMPSLGMSNQFETLSNTVAMSIFVITLVVNICIQLVTGVISSSLIIEHCIILCCMLLLLTMLWKATLDISFVKESPSYGIMMKKHRRTSEKSMLERLINLYEHGYSNNAQIVLNKQPTSAAVSVLCLVSLVVHMQAVLRNFPTIMFKNPSKSPKETSDYSWSIWPILVTQTVFLTVGCAVTCFRWYSLSDYVWEYDVSGREKIVIKQDMSSGSMFPFSKLYTCRQIFTLFIDGVVSTIVWIIKPILLLFGQAKPDKYHKDAIHTYIQIDGEFKRYKPNRSHRDFELWCKDRCMRNIKRWMDKSESDPLAHLNKLLSRINPSRQPLMSFSEKRHAFNLSILSVAVLVRTAEVAFPRHLNTPLMEACREVFVLIDFIESKINPGNKRKARFARALWKGPGFDIPISVNRSLSEVQLAVEIIEKLRCDHLEFELYSIRKYITSYQSYCTIQGLYDEIEQLFVNILHFYLSLLPIAIHKDITGGPDEELEERAKAALKLVSKMGPLEDHIKWAFPETEHPISHLTAPIRFVRDTEDWSSAQANEHFNGTASPTLADVVIQNV